MPEQLPHPEVFLTYLRAGVCPFCGKVGYVKITPHLTRVHGLTMHQIKNLAGVKRHEPVVSPEYSRAVSEKNKEIGLRPTPETYAASRGVPHEYTDAGKAVQREKIKDFHNNPLHQSYASRHLTPAQRREMGRRGGKATARNRRLRKHQEGTETP